jgi:hypothetical protein
VRAHGGIRLLGLCANARSDHRRGNPHAHLRSGVERAVGRLYGAVEGDERLDPAGDPVQGSGGHTSDPGSGFTCLPSWKLDNKIQGAAWLDDVSLKAAH